MTGGLPAGLTGGRALNLATVGAIGVVAVWSATVALGASPLLVDIPKVHVALLLAAAAAAGISVARWSLACGRQDASRRLTGRRASSAWRAAAATAMLAAIAITAAGLVATAAAPKGFRLLVLAAGFGAAGAGWLAARAWPRTRALELALVGEVLAIWTVVDLAVWLPSGTFSPTGHFYDFKVYWAAGVHARHGDPVYLPGPITALPANPSVDWFLYPPPLVPFIQLATHLPEMTMAWLFSVAMLACGALAYRALGLSWRWSLLLLSFPPMVKGLESGNVANLTFLLFSGGVRWGPGLVLGALFKVQNVVPAAWLVRERRWRDLLAGIALVAGLCLVTLPFVGIASWRAWAAGLIYRSQSQVNVPLLYGNSLASMIPGPAFAVVAGLAILAAFRLRGPRGLAGLGLASIVASPSLWLHGFVMALPGLFALPSAVLVWLGLGIAVNDSLGLWSMAALGAAALAVGCWERPVPDNQLHPLAGAAGPWARPVSRHWSAAAPRPTAAPG